LQFRDIQYSDGERAETALITPFATGQFAEKGGSRPLEPRGGEDRETALGRL
jgi:hypothetical protein